MFTECVFDVDDMRKQWIRVAVRWGRLNCPQVKYWGDMLFGGDRFLCAGSVV